jgi:amino acid transporter
VNPPADRDPTAGGPLDAPGVALAERPARPPVPTRFRNIKRLVVGRPLSTERLIHERLGKPTALAVFASDNLSSSAYASEEIIRVLVEYAAIGVFVMVVPITLALLAVLGILLFSYRQTIKAYPQAGGAYLVTRDNFGLLPAQVAGVALLTDYILTVAVSVSAGTAALTSAFGGLFPYRVPISLAFIIILTWGNLRGVKEAGRMFALPTFFFIGMMGVLFAAGLYRFFTGGIHPIPTFPHQELRYVGLFVILKAFASGGAAVTGVEAISNGVPAFKPPEWRNARTTLMWMGSLLGAMFLGLSILAAKLRVVPDPSGAKTVISQVGLGVFGHSALGSVAFYLLQAATMLILVLAANTSFADFPRLASFHAGDHFLPRQLTRYGDRLVFSNGIIALAAVAALLVIVFKASVSALIPLYAIGVFTSFTFSQAGMAVHHLRLKEPGWRTGMFINGLGAFVSGVMTVIIAAVKFTQGAWVILIAIPLMLSGLLRVHHHYQESGRILRDPRRRPPLDFPRQRVIIPVFGDHGDDRCLRSAVAYAHRVFPTEIRVARLATPGADYGDFLRQASLGDEVREVALSEGSPKQALLAYVRKVRREVGPGEVLNVIIPETVANFGLRYIVRERRLQRLKAALLAEPDVVVTNLAHHKGYEALEPGERARRGWGAGADSLPWRHVAVVLVAGAHNGSINGLRYARSLGADEIHALHIETDPKDTPKLVADWDEAVGGRVPLEVVPSPYRQIAGPAFEWVRAKLEADPQTYVTIVIPEFVVRKAWHNLLHNHTPLVLKRTFLFEPSVVVAAVPYRLDLIPDDAPAEVAPRS